MQAVKIVMMVLMTASSETDPLDVFTPDARVTKPIKRSQLRICLDELLGPAEQPARDPSRDLAASQTTANLLRSGARILVAEDNAVNQKLAIRLLEKIGCDAEVVNNGREAIEALGSGHYDAVLMDCQMPEMDGYEATHLIRDQTSPVLDHDIPVIAMTAHAMQGDREKCLAAGMNDYIAKPVTRPGLVKTLDHWLARTVARHAGDPQSRNRREATAEEPDPSARQE